MAVRGLTNRFGAQTVHEDLDLDIHKGGVLGIIGGSGAGKSVLMRSILGLQPYQAGRVWWFGQEVAQLPEFRETKTERPLPGNGAAVNLDTTYATMPVVPMVTEVVREGVSPEVKVLSAHTAVQSDEGTIGKVHGVNAWTADKTVSGIVTRQGVLFPETGMVPIHEIERFGDDVVVLRSRQPVTSSLNE